MNNSLSAIDLYLNKVFKILMVLIPMAALGAAITLVTIKIMGYYQDVSWPALIIFALSCLIYVTIGLIIRMKCEDNFGRLKPEMLRLGRVYLLIVAAIQWNFISYLAPSRDFWAYSLFFIMLSTLFLKSKFVLACIVIIIPSMIVSWILRGSVLLPVRDDLFVSEMILRGVLIALGSTTLWLSTYFIERFLVPELERVAEYDTLTTLRTRRILEESVGVMINKCFRNGETFTLLMCDLDDFKKINDTYGHDCGDEILKLVSEKIINNLGDNDMAFRYGGEEILVIIDADEKIALRRAELIRRDVESGSVTKNGDSISVTITIGAATYNKYDDLDKMIKTADENMYYGKKHGKNQIVSNMAS